MQPRTSEEHSNICEEHSSMLKQDTYSLACFDLNKHLNIMRKNKFKDGNIPKCKSTWTRKRGFVGS